jgi:hypothetical protein
MDPVPGPELLRKCGSAGNRTRSSDHYTTEAVYFAVRSFQNIRIPLYLSELLFHSVSVVWGNKSVSDFEP